MPGFPEFLVSLFVLVGVLALPKLRRIQIDFKRQRDNDKKS